MGAAWDILEAAMRGPLAGLLFATTLLAAESDRLVAVISDDAQDLTQLPIPQEGGRSTSFVHPRHLAPAEDPASVLVVNAWRDRTGPKLTLYAAFGAIREIDDLERARKVELGTYSPALETRTAVESGARYGFPVLWLRLTQVGEGCGIAAGNVRVLAPSLLVEKVERDHSTCYLTVRNLSSRRVTAVGVAQVKDGEAAGEAVSTATSRALILPNETYRMHTGITLGASEQIDPSRVLLTVSFALFDDGTYEGDAGGAMRMLGRKAGYNVQISRFTAFARALMAATADDTRLAADLRDRIASLPDRDQEGLDAALKMYRPADAAAFSAAFVSALAEARQLVARVADDWDRGRTPPGVRSLRDYWTFQLDQLDRMASQ